MKIRQGLSIAVCAAILMIQLCKAVPMEEEGAQGAAAIPVSLQAILARTHNTPKIFQILPRHTLAPVLSEWLGIKDLLKLDKAWPALQGKPVYEVILRRKEAPLRATAKTITRIIEHGSEEEDKTTLINTTNLQNFQDLRKFEKALKRAEDISRAVEKYQEYLSDADQETLKGSTNLQDMREVLKKVDYISRVMERFLRGELIYRPNPNSDEGMIKLPFRAVGLEGEFDLSKCGNAWKHLSINMGYRKGVRAENVKKIEIWITLDILIRKYLETSAAYHQPIMNEWDEADTHLGIFWTRGEEEDMGWYDYLLTDPFEHAGDNNLYKNWTQHACPRRLPHVYNDAQEEIELSRGAISSFICELK